ncbi:MAG: ribosome maturation factor RimM [Dermatophilaceae bacterium]
MADSTSVPAGTLVVARVGRPHGLRGEVTVEALTDSPRRRFVPGATFGTLPDVGPLLLASARVHQETWLLAFAGREGRDAAQELRGIRLTVAASHGATLGPDSDGPSDLADGPDDEGGAGDEGWYPEELAGLVVNDTSGRRIGEVVGLDLRAAQDLLHVRLDDGRRGSVPFVTALVPVVDVPGGRVVVDPPEGLFELDGS